MIKNTHTVCIPYSLRAEEIGLLPALPAHSILYAIALIRCLIYVVHQVPPRLHNKE